jgi:hypothetical protein
MAVPVTVVASGAPAFTDVDTGGFPATPVVSGGMPICLVASGAPGITFVEDTGALIADVRITVDGDQRVTADGDIRETAS